MQRYETDARVARYRSSFSPAPYPLRSTPRRNGNGGTVTNTRVRHNASQPYDDELAFSGGHDAPGGASNIISETARTIWGSADFSNPRDDTCSWSDVKVAKWATRSGRPRKSDKNASTKTRGVSFAANTSRSFLRFALKLCLEGFPWASVATEKRSN